VIYNIILRYYKYTKDRLLKLLYFNKQTPAGPKRNSSSSY